MSDIMKQLLLQLVLILLNAFFAATEIAVISLNEKKVRAQAEGGKKRAKKLLKIIQEPTQFLSTIQIGITLAGFLGSAFAADNFAEKLTGGLVRLFGASAEHEGHNPHGVGDSDYADPVLLHADSRRTGAQTGCHAP